MVRIAKKRRLQLRQVLDNEATCSLELNNNELDNFFTNLKTLYLNKQLCDITFKIDNTLYYAHKVALASSSNFLGGMIMSGMQESGQSIIELNNVEKHLFKYILDYIYGVRVQLISSDVVPLLGLANSYSMIELREKLGNILYNNLSVTNCCSIFAAADAYNCETLKKHALELIFSNFALASKSTGFYELPIQLIANILNSDDILDCDESLIFDAAVRWIESFTDRFNNNNNNNNSNAININNNSRIAGTDTTTHTNIPLTPIHNQTSSSSATATITTATAITRDMVNTYATTLLNLIRFPLMDSCLLSDVIKHHYLMNDSHRLPLLLEAFEYHALRAVGKCIPYHRYYYFH